MRDKSDRCRSVAGFIITLAFLLVPYQAGAADSSSCAAGKTICSGRCLNTATAPRNCGGTYMSEPPLTLWRLCRVLGK